VPSREIDKARQVNKSNSFIGNAMTLGFRVGFGGGHKSFWVTKGRAILAQQCGMASLGRESAAGICPGDMG